MIDPALLDRFFKIIQKQEPSKIKTRLLKVFSIDHPSLDKSLLSEKMAGFSAATVNSMVMQLVSEEWNPFPSDDELAFEKAMRGFLSQHLDALLPKLDDSARLSLRIYASDWQEMLDALAREAGRETELTLSGNDLTAQDVQNALSFTAGEELVATAVFAAFANSKLTSSVRAEFLDVADTTWVTSAFEKLPFNTNENYRRSIVDSLKTKHMTPVVASALAAMPTKLFKMIFRLALSPSYAAAPLSASLRELLSMHTKVIKGRLAGDDLVGFELRKVAKTRTPEADVVTLLDGLVAPDPSTMTRRFESSRSSTRGCEAKFD